MSNKKVNLEEILKPFENDSDHWADQDYSKDKIILAMKEACRQTLELATENAEINKNGCCEDEEFDCSAEINKQSILDTINQVE